MNIEDEIRVKKEKIRADMKKKEEAEQLSAAMRNAGMCPASCVLRLPPSELQPVIKETMPFMRFSNPKIVRSMPDGRTLVREIRYKESPDMYSFDAQLYSNGTGKGSSTYEIWIFKNGAISFSQNGGSNLTWTDVRSKGLDATTVRAKIIEALASQAVQKEKKSSSGGCYIATAVYGSYDCPEVWGLRRYRDYSLKISVLGRLFIRIYYAVSPAFVKLFGKKAWFKLLGRKFLDKRVAALKEAGYSEEEYRD